MSCPGCVLAGGGGSGCGCPNGFCLFQKREITSKEWKQYAQHLASRSSTHHHTSVKSAPVVLTTNTRHHGGGLVAVIQSAHIIRSPAPIVTPNRAPGQTGSFNPGWYHHAGHWKWFCGVGNRDVPCTHCKSGVFPNFGQIHTCRRCRGCHRTKFCPHTPRATSNLMIPGGIVFIARR